MLVEGGFVRATDGLGRVWSWTPAFGRIAALGSPHEIVARYAGLHGPRAAQDAAYVLAGLCDQEDPSPLIGWTEEGIAHPGLMPEIEQIIIARHLMQHGICGTPRPGKGGGFAAAFHAAEFVAIACVHLGLSKADAEGLSMTEWQLMMDAKFPRMAAKRYPTREEFRASAARFEAMRKKRESRRV